MGVSGETLRQALLQLRPEIYGSIAGDKTELEGLTLCCRPTSRGHRRVHFNQFNEC